MTRLTTNFSLEEFACPCCGVSKVDPLLVDGLQQMRDRLGKPIRINSGYRCPKHNAELGDASPVSQHLLGKAADIRVWRMSAMELYHVAILVPQFAGGGIGVYPAEKFIHVDVRGHKARWAQIDGQYVALKPETIGG